MGNIDESTQQREVYGNPPGWSMNQRPAGDSPVKPDDSGASSTPDAEAVPSTEQVPQDTSTEQATPPTSQASPEEEIPFHKHPRWQELQREREELRQQNQRLLDMANQAIQRPVTIQPQQPVNDFWAGKVDHPDPATAQFWQTQRYMIDMAKAEAKQAAIQELTPVISAGREELAQIKISDFRKSNPEIKPGSPEEAQIISYMNGTADGIRHTLESAKRNAMYDKLETENRALKSKQASIPQKRAAAGVEQSSGIPQTAGLPQKPGDWRDKAGEVIDKGGKFNDVLKAVFG